MALTDGEKFRKSRHKSRPLDAKTNLPWSDKQKMETVTMYLMLGGNASLTSKTVGIPLATIEHWKRSEWWHDIVGEIRREERLTLSTKLKKIVDRSWDLVEDRLENGDFIYNQKTGEMVRKPVTARDVSKIAHDTTMLRSRLDITENHTVHQDQIEDKLNKLAQAFSDLAQGKLQTGPIEDAVIIEGDVSAVHEEREEGLQEGERTLQLTAGTEEEPQ